MSSRGKKSDGKKPSVLVFKEYMVFDDGRREKIGRVGKAYGFSLL